MNLYLNQQESIENDKSNNDKYVKKVKTQINQNKQFLKKIEKRRIFI